MKFELISQIFEVCIIPLLGVLVGFLVDFIKTKKNELINQSQNEIAKKYIEMLANTIEISVIATNQTYVDALKQKGEFDAAAQTEAFNKTKNAVLSILTDEAKKYLTEAYGDLNVYIGEQIEALVNKNK